MIKPDQLKAIKAYMDALVDMKISDALGRDGLHESVRLNQLERELECVFMDTNH